MKIVIVGLGYVGCPLAYELSKHFTVCGFDINETRVQELENGIDRTNELTSEQVKSAQWHLTSEPNDLTSAAVIIVTVPTPTTDANVPDLAPVRKATETISTHLRRGQTIIYESTVYPGVTQDYCIPILENGSGLSYASGDFHVAYSPERINPGDKVNTLTTVVKIVSGDTPETLNLVDSIYSKITKTHRAPSIKVAEAAKVIENTQRDVNIGLMNELAQIFGRLHIDTHDVIEAAGTKWNFLKFYPGLVGGHCISVDPYYLTHRAEEVGYIPSLILAAREVNDQMPALMTHRTLQKLSTMGLLFAGTVVTILGCTFKENVPDIRNSKVFALAKDFEAWGLTVQIVDPLADRDEVAQAYGVAVVRPLPHEAPGILRAHAVILAVAHEEFVSGSWDLIKSYAIDTGRFVVTDLKAVLDRAAKPDNVVVVRP